jgi:hypothetical protein
MDTKQNVQATGLPRPGRIASHAWLYVFTFATASGYPLMITSGRNMIHAVTAIVDKLAEVDLGLVDQGNVVRGLG